MSLFYILLGVIIVLVIIKLYLSTTEAFQVQDASGITIDTTNIDMAKLNKEVSNIQLNTTDVDSRPLDDLSRICDSIQSQINTFENVKAHYRTLGDWSTIRITNESINKLKEQMTTLGCQNNNSQNN